MLCIKLMYDKDFQDIWILFKTSSNWHIGFICISLYIIVSSSQFLLSSLFVITPDILSLIFNLFSLLPIILLSFLGLFVLVRTDYFIINTTIHLNQLPFLPPILHVFRLLESILVWPLSIKDNSSGQQSRLIEPFLRKLIAG